MNKRRFASMVSILAATFLFGACGPTISGSGGTGSIIGSLTGSSRLSIRNMSQCDLLVDVDYRQESMVVEIGEKRALTFTPALVTTRRGRAVDVDVGIVPLKKKGDCRLAATMENWRVYLDYESNEYWIVQTYRDRLHITRR